MTMKSKKTIRKSKRVKSRKAQPGSLHPAGYAASSHIEWVIGKLETHEEVLRLSKGDLKLTPSAVQLGMLVVVLKLALKELRHNDKLTDDEERRH